MRVRLGSETDLDGFRRAARGLLAEGVPPAQVQWQVGDADGDLFGAPPSAQGQAAIAAPVAVPARFIALCGAVVLHADPQRFALLYRLLWRLAHEPQLRHDPLDADMLLAARMGRAVQREMHKMRAFVRFREVDDGQGTLHVAWFEPQHHIVEANAPFFSRRFANMRWVILTPRRSVRWEEGGLQFGPGARREDAPPPDAGEALWLTYYRSIFNPARLNLPMMVREMPRRYWDNLPESALIAPLAAQARERSGRMLTREAEAPRKAIPLIAAPVPPPDGLPGLHAAIRACRACPLAACATQAVCGEGPLRPPLMLVGEQPGDAEDLAGRPFVGPAGQLLREAMRDAGMDPAAAYLSNAVRHFKFELRGRRRIHKTAGQREAQACQPWLDQEITLVQPRALVALGATAARALLGRPVAIARERGQWLRRADGLPVLVTWHPSALLRMPPGEHAFARPLWEADLALAIGVGKAVAPPPDGEHSYSAAC